MKRDVSLSWWLVHRNELGREDLKNGTMQRTESQEEEAQMQGVEGTEKREIEKVSWASGPRKEASSREHPPDFFCPCLSFVPVPGVRRLWRGLFLQLITIV